MELRHLVMMVASLEIAIGASGFQDIIAAGGSFINGAYNRTSAARIRTHLQGDRHGAGIL